MSKAKEWDERLEKLIAAYEQCIAELEQQLAAKGEAASDGYEWQPVGAEHPLTAEDHRRSPGAFWGLGRLLSDPAPISDSALVELGAAKQHDTLYLLPPSPAGLGGFISVLESGVELHHACNAYRVQSMGQLRCLLLGVS